MVTEVDKIAEYYIIYGIINSSKLKIYINHYLPIQHGCMNMHRGRAKYDDFRILLGIIFSSLIVMKRIIMKLKAKNMLLFNGTHMRVILPLI